MARVPARAQTRKRIAAVLRGDFDNGAWLRHAARPVVGEALDRVGRPAGGGPRPLGGFEHERISRYNSSYSSRAIFNIGAVGLSGRYTRKPAGVPPGGRCRSALGRDK